jgi:hypothetical protein
MPPKKTTTPDVDDENDASEASRTHHATIMKVDVPPARVQAYIKKALGHDADKSAINEIREKIGPNASKKLSPARKKEYEEEMDRIGKNHVRTASTTDATVAAFANFAVHQILRQCKVSAFNDERTGTVKITHLLTNPDVRNLSTSPFFVSLPSFQYDAKKEDEIKKETAAVNKAKKEEKEKKAEATGAGAVAPAKAGGEAGANRTFGFMSYIKNASLAENAELMRLATDEEDKKYYDTVRTAERVPRVLSDIVGEMVTQITLCAKEVMKTAGARTLSSDHILTALRVTMLSACSSVDDIDEIIHYVESRVKMLTDYQAAESVRSAAKKEAELANRTPEQVKEDEAKAAAKAAAEAEKKRDAVVKRETALKEKAKQLKEDKKALGLDK